MTDELNASLSALMDGEVDDDERQRGTDALLADPNLRAHWQRYHLARAVLQRAAVEPLPDVGLHGAARLRAALDAEPAHAVADDELAMADNVVMLPVRRAATPARPARRALIGLAAAMGAGVIGWFAVGNGLSGSGLSGSGLSGSGLSGSGLSGSGLSGSGLSANGLTAKSSGAIHRDVAVVTVAGAQVTGENLWVADAIAPAATGNVVAVSYPATAMSEAEAQRMQLYMFLHAQQARMNHASQAMPFAKVVSFETP